MKRRYMPLIILGLILVVALSGCKKKVEVDNPIDPIIIPKPAEVVGEDDKITIMNGFADVIKDHGAPDKIVSFINENISKLTEIEGDIMLDSLERELEHNISAVSNLILELDKDGELIKVAGSEFEFPVSSISKIKNKELKKEVLKAYESMYKLVNIEGAFYPIIDYSKLKKYDEYTSVEWMDYINIKTLDSDNIYLVDGGLRISYDELSERLLKTENYLNSYVDGKRQEEVLYLYEQKINNYLKGALNTPVADLETGLILDNVLESYEKTSNVENYITSHIVYKYLELIKSKKNIIDDRVLKEADNLITEAMRILKEFK